ncbi:MAG: phosphate signaling complex protein PhoU [Acidobacteriota bacterium]
MERHLDQQLEEIRQNLLRMGGLIEQMIDKANRALVERDEALIADVITTDQEVDQIEMDLDEACLATMARNQPTAVDLRFLVAVIKITNDLERVGDSAVNIVQSARRLNEEPPLKPYIDLPRMSEMTQRMIRESLDAFSTRNTELAVKVCQDDDAIDAVYRQLFRELLTFMIEDPKTVSRCLHLLLIARNLERIADHATNIAENVIYYVEGRDVRHSLAKSSTGTVG